MQGRLSLNEIILGKPEIPFPEGLLDVHFMTNKQRQAPVPVVGHVCESLESREKSCEV